MSGIRVTYSGMISLVVGLSSVFTGMFFTLILTRTLTTVEYGTWSLINILIYYVMLIPPVISYWSTREIARGSQSGTTAILSTGFLSIGGVITYIIIAFLIGSHANVNHYVVFLASILIPFMFLNSILAAINLGSKPQATSYGTLLQGLGQSAIGFILIYFFNMRIEGVILTLMISYSISNLILFSFAKDKIKRGFKKEFLRKWIRHFWIPLYPSLSTLVANLDIVIFTLITSSVNGIAFWTAAMALPNTISNSGLVSRAVYSKLLDDKGDRQYVRENLTHLFYFAIPLTLMGIVFARPTLFALNPHYETVSLVTMLLSIYIFFNVLSNVFISYLTGLEKVDKDEKSTFKNYIKSKLFFLPTVRFIQYSTYALSLGIGLLFLVHWATQVEMLIYWSSVILATEIPVSLFLFVLFRRSFLLSLDVKSPVKYLIVGFFVFGSIYFIESHFLQYSNSIFDFIPHLLIFMAISFVCYLGITYAVDLKTRVLFKSVLDEMKSRF